VEADSSANARDKTSPTPSSAPVCQFAAEAAPTKLALLGLPGPEQPAHRLGRGLEPGGAEALNLDKTGGLEEESLVPDRDRAAYSLRPGLAATEQMAGQLAQPHHIGELQAPARLQHPEELAEQGRFVGGEVDHPVGDYHRKGSGGIG